MKTIPKRRHIPIITDLLEYRQAAVNTIPYTEKIIKKYGEVADVSFTGVKNFFIHDPEVIKEMLVSQSSKFRRTHLLRVFRKYLGQGLFTSDGALHKQHKRLMKPAFYPARIESYADIMVKCTEDEVATWTNGETINLSQALTRITLNIITKTMFGADFDQNVLDKAGKNFQQAYKVLNRIMQNPVYVQCLEKDIKIPLTKKLYRLKEELDAIIYGMIDTCRKEGNKNRLDLLAMLVDAKDEHTGESMTDEEIRDEIMTIFLAGHETTTLALEWTWYLLGKHPDIAGQFYMEVKNTIQGRSPRAEDYKALSLTKNIFKEALRLYPPGWTFARETTEDVQIQDYHFPKGSVLWTVIYQVHRNEKYFPGADYFVPERWDDEKMKDLPKYAYFPFGGGNRMCIGEGFAWMEGVLILATIASKCFLQMPHDFTTVIKPSFTLKAKDSIMMKVNKWK